jgi:hypothetical protein
MRKSMAFVMLVASFVAWAQEQSVAAPKLLRAQDLPIEVEPEALQRQYNALRAMRLDSITYSRLGSVKRISGDTGLALPSRVADLKQGDSGADILELFKDVLLANGTETLKVIRDDAVSRSANSSMRAMRLSEEIHGIPVLNSLIGINYDDATKHVSKFGAIFIPDRGLDRDPKISAERAEQLVPEALTAMKDSGAAQVEILEGTHLAYYHDPADPTPPRLVWVVRAQLEGGMQWAYYVNAITGMLIDRVPLTQTLTRSVYDANGVQWTIPAQLPSTSMTIAQINASPYGALEVYNHILVADTKLRLRFPLPSANFPTSTKQVIRYPFTSPNASHGTDFTHDYILYSALTATTNSSTGPPDITYHEYAHGIGKRTFSFGADTFDYQSGALHEGFADIGASAVDIAYIGAITSASWRMGEGWYFLAPSAVTRSMANPADAHPSVGPGNDWFPLRPMGKGFAHHNSTILSHAYYLSIYGGLNAGWAKPYIPEIMVPALHLVPATAEQRARQIFMDAFFDFDVSIDPTFLTVKDTAMFHANLLYGTAERTSIQKAFEALGVGYQCTAQPTTAPSFILEDFLCAGRFRVNWPDIPGVNRYIAQIAPQIYGWSFGQVAVDGDLNHCMPQISTFSMIRMRGCNNCGCGPWSPTQYMNYYGGPCL